MQTFVVIGGYHWGSSTTLPEAKQCFTRFGGSLSSGYAVLTFADGTEFLGVDEVGRYHYRGDAPSITEVAARREARKGARS